MPRLDLDPVAAAPACAVGSLDSLHDDALVAALHCVSEEVLSLLGFRRQQARNHQVRSYGRQAGEPLARWVVNQVRPVQVEGVEQEDRQRDLARLG